MNDIFISYSSEDSEKVTKIRNDFERVGFTCWMANRKGDLHSGDNYMSVIPPAINKSKVFICFISKNSIKSHDVAHELSLANGRCKYGIRIFGVILEDDIAIPDLPDNFEYIYTNNQIIYWSDAEAREDLTEQIKKAVNGDIITDKAEIIPNLPKTADLIGRETELEHLEKAMQKHRKLCLYGIGGIGKTALTLAYAKNVAQSVSVVYLPIEESVLRTVGNDEILKLDSPEFRKKQQDLSGLNYARYKLSVLENSVCENTLIILDNVDTLDDPMIDRILSLSCNIIVVTRHGGILPSWESYHIAHVASPDACVRMFETYYGRKAEEYEKEMLLALLKSVAYHTMSVILLAKNMKYTNTPLSKYTDVGQLKSENILHIHHLADNDKDKTEITAMYRRLQELFNSRGLDINEKRVIKIMILSPTVGIDRELFINLVGQESVVSLKKFEQTGWIEYNDVSNDIYLHPVINDVIREEFDISAEDPDIKSYIQNFVNAVSNCYNQNYEENIKYKELALSLIRHFPEPNVDNYKQYLTISKLLWVLNMFDMSLNIQYKIRMLFIDDKGKHSYNEDEAEALMQLGFVHHSNGDYKKAKDSLYGAAKIFGNKFAAALSHQAQAMAFISGQPFEEIRPLFEASLKIREKYWPDSPKEAISCHLYAKALSKYEIDLETAKTLEKRAFKIYKRENGGDADISSVEYMLGWLYIQTAEDEDDIEYGIEFLEDARKHRLKVRDEFHPWMEDIYLKLALAYEKISNYTKARKYFEILREVQIRKYHNDMTTPEILDTYRHLQKIYSGLGENEAAKQCKRILRKYD